MSLLKRIWMQAGYLYDSNLNVMFGEKNGFTFVVKDHGQNQCSLLFSVKGDQAAVESDLGRAVQLLSKAVRVASVKQYKLTCTIKPGFTKKKTESNILQAIEDVSTYLAQNNYQQCCELSADTKDVHLYVVGNQLSFLNEASYHLKSQELDKSEQESLLANENIFLGVVGAFLGSLVGVAAIVIIGQLGYVSILSGIVMGFSVIKGYELFARRLSTRGAIVSGLIILVMTYLANQLDWAFSAATAYEVSVFETFPYVNDLLAEGIIDSTTYFINLVLIYLTTVIAAVVMIVNALKTESTKFDIRKLY
ncbi:hypothetical protein ACTGZQ_02360 [Streptococcus suis]